MLPSSMQSTLAGTVPNLRILQHSNLEYLLSRLHYMLDESDPVDRVLQPLHPHRRQDRRRIDHPRA